MTDGARLSEIAGDGRATDQRPILEKYGRDCSFVKPVMPAYVVMPRNTEDIEKIVKFANDTLTPIVPVSSGSPHFRGDTVPGIGGAIIVDLSHMKKILRIDRPNRVAMVEPGVTFEELQTEVSRVGLRLNAPLLPRRSKSVVGSLLEREPVIMPGYQWDISDPLDCVEVVFGTGDRFRTGSASGPGNIEEQLAAGGAQDEPLGPGQTSWHRAVQGAQGTLGIVTWASTRCELLPKVEEPFVVGSPYLDKMLELVHWLVRLRLVNECFVLNETAMATIVTGTEPHKDRSLKETLPCWTLFFTIAGYDYYPDERVKYQTRDMMAAAQRVALLPVKAIGGISAYDLLALFHRPSPEPYWKLRNKGACQDLFFLTTYDKLPEHIQVLHNIADEADYPITEIGCYLQPVVQGTACHCEFNLFYSPENQREVERVRQLCNIATRNLADRGAFFSRPYGETAAGIMNRDAATVIALKKIKAMFDPNNIMNPGKLCF